MISNFPEVLSFKQFFSPNSTNSSVDALFLVGCLNSCLQRTNVQVGSPQPSSITSGWFSPFIALTLGKRASRSRTKIKHGFDIQAIMVLALVSPHNPHGTWHHFYLQWVIEHETQWCYEPLEFESLLLNIPIKNSCFHLNFATCYSYIG